MKKEKIGGLLNWMEHMKTQAAVLKCLLISLVHTHTHTHTPTHIYYA